MFNVCSHYSLVPKISVVLFLGFSLGCSLPPMPDDDAFEVLGGIVHRDHPTLGRANSAFELSPSDLSAESEPIPAAPMVPSFLTEPKPLEALKHSPIIP